jgi:catechol 2,3-dioxygenase-like lactoylglutathione lyase family enzyme
MEVLMDIVGPHHIALLTPNFDRLRDFYVETLGFPICGGYSDRRITFIKVGSIAVELIEQPEASAGQRGGWGHVALEVADIDATYQALVEKGVPFHIEPKDFPETGPVGRIAFFRDPDGNELQLVQPFGPGRYPNENAG